VQLADADATVARPLAAVSTGSNGRPSWSTGDLGRKGHLYPLEDDGGARLVTEAAVRVLEARQIRLHG
jgi:hypothetical protein